MSGDVVDISSHPRFGAEPTEYSTVKGAAAYFTVHQNTIRNWIRAGMPSRKFGGVRRLNLVQCEAWLNGQNTDSR